MGLQLMCILQMPLFSESSWKQLVSCNLQASLSQPKKDGGVVKLQAPASITSSERLNHLL